MGYPASLTVYYGYDSFGRLSTMTSQGAGGWSVIADSFLYQPVSEQLYAWRFGNQLPRLAMLDADGRLTRSYGGVQHVDFGYNQADLDTYGVKTLSGATTSFILQGGLIAAGLATIRGWFQA